MNFPPGPTAPELVQTWRWIKRPYSVLDGCRAKYGKTFTLGFVGGRKLVITSDREVVKEVFSGDPELFLSGRANQAFKEFLGRNSLLTLDGKPHKEARRLLMPPFRGERMEAYDEVMRELTLEEMALWPRGKAFPVSDAMRRLSLNIIYSAVFGIRDVERRDSLTRPMTRLMSKTSGLLAFLPKLQIDFGPISPWGRFLRSRKEITDILYAEIKAVRETTEGRDDILARLIRESEKLGIELNDDDLCDHLMALVGAGHETIATAMGWTFQLLLSHPDVLARAKAEVDEVLGGEPVTAAHVRRFDYLDAVIQESLRLFPPIPIVVRLLSREAEVGGYTLPADTIVCPCSYLLHREPELYPDPLVFKPERLLGNRPGPFEFITFGGGVRTCVGVGFSYFERKIILATVLSRLNVRLAGAPSLAYRRKGIVLAPREGTPLIVEELEKNA